MCVIAYADVIRPTDDQIRNMWDANKYGGGVAWRVNVDGEARVRWKKGLDMEEMLEMNRVLPMPYVLHFRIPSNGTTAGPLGCHPFQIDVEATVDFEGETTGYVLFHNGFWTGWQDKLQNIAIHGFVKLPDGPWTDSRGLAWASYHLGFGLLELSNEKLIAFSPDNTKLFGAWMAVQQPDEDGVERRILVSNKVWDKPPPTTSLLTLAQQAITPKAVTGELGGASRQGTFQGTGSGTLRIETEGRKGGGHQQQRIQTKDEAVVEGVKEGHVDTLATCSMCKKQTHSYVPEDGHIYCWQCWSDDVKKSRLEKCGYCRVGWAASRRIDNDRWICLACWDTNGQPATVLASRKEVSVQ